MNNNQNTKGQAPHLLNWQLAYAARELRHNKSVTLSCLTTETGLVFEQLSSFSTLSPIQMKTVKKPNSQEVLMEVFQTH